VAAQGCSPEADRPIEDDGSPGASSVGAGGAGGAKPSGAGGDDGVGGTVLATTGVGGGGNPDCQGGTPDDDKDMDGFSEVQGDCNDCDAFVNPSAVEVIAEPDENGMTLPPVDEDCDTIKDNVAPPCDDGLVLNSEDPMDAAKAVGMCNYITSAKWVLADGSAPPVDPVKLANFHLGHGILDNLGPNNPPQEGTRMLALSSGTARKEGHPEYIHRNFEKGYISNAPFGFPKESPSCAGVKTQSPRDATGLSVEFVAPSNAQGISFDFNFFTFEWPVYICTNFNDFFIANLTYSNNLDFPPGQTDGNISFDGQKNPISVNNAFLDVCACPSGPPCQTPPNAPTKSFDCILGKTSLIGTAYDSDEGFPTWTNGATGWLRTNAPVTPGKKFTIRLVTYDSTDGKVDSMALIDNWKWSAKPGTVKTVIVPK
jgi:hypothetical protein